MLMPLNILYKFIFAQFLESLILYVVNLTSIFLYLIYQFHASPYHILMLILFAVGCRSDQGCLSDEVCISRQCQKLCMFSNTCGLKSICGASAHRAQCSCPAGYTGNPIIECRKSKHA